jgi:hypothetical protein
MRGSRLFPHTRKSRAIFWYVSGIPQRNAPVRWRKIWWGGGVKAIGGPLWGALEMLRISFGFYSVRTPSNFLTVPVCFQLEYPG